MLIIYNNTSNTTNTTNIHVTNKTNITNTTNTAYITNTSRAGNEGLKVRTFVRWLCIQSYISTFEASLPRLHNVCACAILQFTLVANNVGMFHES